MKNIFFLTFLFITGSITTLFAQFEGKRFLSGTAGINFRNDNQKNEQSTNGYDYGFEVSIGKFKTNTKATGWRLSNYLAGAKNLYRTYNNGDLTGEYDKSGINDIGVGVGRFWQFYKHFNDKIGIFGGPDVSSTFSKARRYVLSDNGQYLSENKTDKIQLSLGLSAGIYYHFSEKWWVTGSLAFSNPISVEYDFLSTKVSGEILGYKSKQLNYSFSPNFTFPNVGFGLRYFLR